MVTVPSFVEVPGFAGSGSRIQPPEPLYSNGYLPGQTLPAEYENFFLNGFSLNGLTEQASIVSVVTELNNFLTAYGTTPNPALFNQFLTTMQAQLALKANLASPTFTGTVTIPAIPEPSIGSNPTTKTYVDGADSALQSAITAEAVLARNASNLSSGTVPGARLTGGGQQIITSGSGNFTVPANVYTIKVTLIGGGGGGGGMSSGNTTYGGGGGGGGISRGVLSVTPGQSIAYSVGAAGAGVSGSNGTAGGDTTFTGVTTATGGQGGTVGSTQQRAGGLGGTGNLGSIGPGGAGGIGGGLGAGQGGPLRLGAGTGNPATGPGGGGGAALGSAGADQTGGAGFTGLIVVEW